MEQIGSFIFNHWLLFLALLAVFSLLLMSTARSRLLGFQEIKTTEAVQMMNHDEPLLLDTRSADEFAQGHILGALNISHDQLPERLGELDGWR
ncbi:MAG: rhodanese-like domain-containing protein, partial [Gammaproteobacteria bacterium]